MEEKKATNIVIGVGSPEQISNVKGGGTGCASTQVAPSKENNSGGNPKPYALDNVIPFSGHIHERIQKVVSMALSSVTDKHRIVLSEAFQFSPFVKIFLNRFISNAMSNGAAKNGNGLHPNSAGRSQQQPLVDAILDGKQSGDSSTEEGLSDAPVFGSPDSSDVDAALRALRGYTPSGRHSDDDNH